jgi:hypothetical protein
MTQADRFRAAFGELSQKERDDLEFCAWDHAWGTGFDDVELFTEAVQRTCDETRHWPDNVPVAPYLRMVIASIASSERKKYERFISDGNFSYRVGGSVGTNTVADLDGFASEADSPEEKVIKVQVLSLFLSLFEGKAIETTILNRMLMGHGGELLRGDIPRGTFDNAYRQIFRTMKRFRDQCA